jgi:outer membrane autotransporter protein
MAVYGSYNRDRWYVDNVFSYAWINTDTKRSIDVDTIHRTASAEYGGRRFALYTETGLRGVPINGWIFEPVGTLQYTSLRQDDFVETGAGGLGLIGDVISTESLRSGVGIRVATTVNCDGWSFAPEFRARWLHEFANENADYRPAFVGAPDRPFIILGTMIDRDSALLGLGVNASWRRNLSVNLDYDLRSNSDLQVHNLTASVRFSW